MSINKRDNGKWEARVSYKDKSSKTGYRQKVKNFARKSEAREWEVSILDSMNKGTDVSKSNLTFSKYFADWINTYKTTGVRPHTHEIYVGNLNHVKAWFKDTKLPAISRADYQKFLNSFGKSHSLATSQKLHRQVHSAIRDAVAEGIIHRDFAYKAKITGSDPKPESEKVLTFDEYTVFRKYLIDNANYHRMTQEMMLFQLETGTRFEECAGLTWDNLDLNNGIVHITRQWDARTQNFTKTKGGGKADGDITIGTKYCQFLRDYRDQQNEWLSDHGIKNPLNLVFWSDHGTIVQNGTANTQLKIICSRLGIKEVTSHAMRHTHASILILQKVSLPYVQHRLRHQKLETTINTYVHFIEQANGISNSDTLAFLDKGFENK